MLVFLLRNISMVHHLPLNKSHVLSKALFDFISFLPSPCLVHSSLVSGELSMTQPQGLCTCCFLCLDSSLRSLLSPPYLQAFHQVVIHLVNTSLPWIPYIRQHIPTHTHTPISATLLMCLISFLVLITVSLTGIVYIYSSGICILSLENKLLEVLCTSKRVIMFT